MAPWAAGRSLNFMYGEDTTAEQVRAFYDPADYRRLAICKSAYDPANVYSMPPQRPASGLGPFRPGTVARALADPGHHATP